MSTTNTTTTSPPTHPSLISVISQPGSFASYAITQKPLAAGSLLQTLQTPELTRTTPAYSSVQVGSGPEDHVELNSDFLYINHSCEPNLEFHTRQEDGGAVVIDVRVANRVNGEGKSIGLAAGEMLTFFYPSTEWDMAQAFDCRCETAGCLGSIQGARYLPSEIVLGRGEKGLFFNEHILRLKREQQAMSDQS